MTLSINTLIRRFSTYEDDAVKGITEADVTTTVIPMAQTIFNELTMDTMSISDYATASTTHSVANFCIAHLSCYIIDHMKDRVHVDPETGGIENRHWKAAYDMMLAVWGLIYKGDKVLPGEIQASRPAFELARVDSQLTRGENKSGLRTWADKEKYIEQGLSQTSS
jgi:hypothetical protein